MREGPLAALDAMEQATGEREANVIGYCLGGTLLAATLAYMAAKGDDRRQERDLFRRRMVDFSEAGELSVFIDEEQLARARGADGRRRATSKRRDMAHDLQHAARQRSDLVVRGQQLPARQAAVPVRPALLELRLDAHAGGDAQLLPAQDVPGEPAGRSRAASRSAGVPIDLRKVKTPAFLLSTREDHIAPWRSTYAATQLYGGPVKFVLSASGHIAGVVNPPGSKYGHWENDQNPPTARRMARRRDAGARGSWWPVWEEWVSQYAGGEVPARQPGDGKLKPIEDAPGSYVRVKSE